MTTEQIWQALDVLTETWPDDWKEQAYALIGQARLIDEGVANFMSEEIAFRMGG